MLNLENLQQRLERLSTEEALLRSYQQVSREEFTNSRGAQYIAYYSLIVAAQACMDIAAHIVANTTQRKPTNNTDLFVILAESSIISHELAQRLGQIVGFRNVLAHRYLDVDADRVYDNLQADVPDLAQFQRAIVQWIESRQSPS